MMSSGDHISPPRQPVAASLLIPRAAIAIRRLAPAMDSFEKESKLHERRAARQRQMRLMEEAASGMPLESAAAGNADLLDAVAGVPSPVGPPTMADMRSNNFVIDDDEGDEDDGPPSVFASANLWTSNSATNLKLDDEKMGFITGSDNESPGNKGWRDAERSEGRDLLKRAAKRLSGDHTAFHTHGDSDGDDFRQRSGFSLPTCCLLHRRTIAATLMILTLLVVLIAIVAPGAKNARSQNGSGAVPPWADPPNGPLGGLQNYLNEAQQAKFNRIKDRILEHGVSHASTLEDPSSPQHKALTWLVRDDERQLDVTPFDDEGNQFSAGDVDKERTLFNRYALAVLWFQTTDLRIVEQSMTASDIEDPFDNPVDPLEFTQQDVTWRRNQNWMTGKGLCLWHGVTCHPKGEEEEEKYDGDFYVAILNLTDNNVKGVVPREVYTGFEKLKALDLSRNGMKGTIGRELGMLEDLEDLFLFENNFSGVIPDEIGMLSNLYNLYINNNKFRGQLPSSVGDLTKLRGASMFNNRLEGRIPDSLGNLKDIIALYLDSNQFTGQVPSSIGRMVSMIDLRLRDNDLSGTIPAELGDLDNLETLYLDSNAKIKGTIPAELSNLAKLTELHLYEMDLTGTLPSELGLLEGLVYLYLDTNELRGTIPEEWGGMRDLEQLFLTGNDLSGWLPVSIRGMKSLEMIRAADNNLSGPIPSDIGKLTKLEYIYLEGNNFSGNVPSELGELTKLKAMHLHDSSLVGEMPSEICKLRQDFSLQDLTADCEELTCPCCKCDS